MSFYPVIQTGPNADSLRQNAPAIVPVPASGVVNMGTPLRRNVTAIQGQSPSAYPYTAVANVNGGDQAQPLTATGGSYVYGVYNGPTVNQASVGSTATSLVTGLVARSGATPVLVGTTSGGTAITVGCFVGMSSALGIATGVVTNNTAAAVNFGTVLTGPASTNGSIIGTVLGYPLVSSIGVSAVLAGSSVPFAPPSVIGFSSTQALVVNPGLSNAETIVPSSYTVGVAAQNNVTFGNVSTGSIVPISMILGNASTGAIPNVPGGIVTVTIAPTTAWTGTSVAAAYAAALNTAFATYGIAPTNIPGVGGIQPLGIITAATSVLSLTAAIPSPLYNAVAVSLPIAWVSSITSGGTSLGSTSVGAYPTVFATFQNNHAANEPIVGAVQTFGATLTTIPQPGGSNIALAIVDMTDIN